MTFITLESGVFPVDLTEGVYNYWASTPCGNIAGSWNVNVGKTLFLSCKNNLPALSLAKSVLPGCLDFGYVYTYYDDLIFVSQTHYGENSNGNVPTYEESKFDMVYGWGYSIVEGCLTTFDNLYYITSTNHSP